MIFSKSRPVKIVLVGTGGTGGYIVPQLYRLLYALDRPIWVILCDGDLVEEKNLGRQNFIEADLGKNKAMVLAERYSNAFGIETSYIPQYVEDEEMLEELLEPLQYPQNRYVKYKELRKAAGLPALLLSIPNNFDRFDPSDNQLGLDYRDLMQHLKDKEPAYYYTDILIPNGQTLAHFIQHM